MLTLRTLDALWQSLAGLSVCGGGHGICYCHSLVESGFAVSWLATTHHTRAIELVHE